MGLREKMRQILQAEDELTEIVQLVGKDSLSEDQKAVLKVSITLDTPENPIKFDQAVGKY